MSELVIKDLHVNVADKEILQGVNLTVKQGEIHAIMGPNGTGKTTLASTLMGHPSYVVTKGEVLFKGQNILELEVDERSRLGLFLAFQYPVSIPALTAPSVYLQRACAAGIAGGCRWAKKFGRLGRLIVGAPASRPGVDAG